MLTVRITTARGTSTYKDEFIDMSWLVKNNEDALFNATVPTLTATIKLNAYDSYIEALKRGDKVEVYNSESPGLNLIARVLEVSVVKRTKEVEIGLSADFLTQTNTIWGMLKLPQGSLADIKSEYGLSMFKAFTDTTVPEIFVNVQKKADLILGIAWAYSKRRNLALLPFTDYANRATGEGVAMFENIRPEEELPGAPIYEITPDQIIDYDVSSALPPVTHLRTTTIGEIGPTPQIPPLDVMKYTAVENDDIKDNVRSFYIQESQLGAVWVAQEDENGDVTSQSLTWTDGVSMSWSSSQKKKIIGILRDCYIEVATSTTIRAVDRVSGAIKHTWTVASTANLWEDQGKYNSGKTNVANRDPRSDEFADVEVFWLPRAIMSGTTATIGLVYHYTERDGDYEYTTITVSSVSTAYVYRFGNSFRVASIGETNVDNVYYDVVYTGFGAREIASLGVTVMPTNANLLVTKVFETSATMPLEPSGETLIDLWTTDLLSEEPYFAPAYMIAEADILTTGTVHRRTFLVQKSGSQFRVLQEQTGVGRLHWIVDAKAIGLTLEQTPVLSTLDDDWKLLMYNNASYRWTITMQEGKISAWSGDQVTVYTISQGAFTAMVYRGDNLWEVYLQASTLPFFSRKLGEMSTAVKIADGSTNVVDLPFKVGPLQQSETWDEVLGRIEIDISEFSVYDENADLYVQKSIQSLHTMAVGAYAKVFLDPEDSNDFVTVKITAFRFTYQGVVEAKVSGIIVE